MNHLSEEDLQKYLDDPINPEQAEIENHLSSCLSCRQNLATYQKLFTELNKPVADLLPPHFAAQVTIKIQAANSRQSRVFEWLFLTVGFFLSVAASLYFLNSKNIAGSILRFFQNNFTWNTEMLSLVNSMIEQLNGNVDFILFAGALIILIAAIDRLFVRPRLRLG